ncbi:hypothetical protein [Aliikangiella sp. IMCC44359]|uniref:hypothetical protein n=1 Tax=Aliikangiella sp. IMCC44359 TaxID=3459125 RepID=UPI00403AD24C
MIITKLEVKGSGKETAKIELKKGLNVIAGASDTGKSYICQCFQFIFGADKVPKPIDQSKGYTSVEVSFSGSQDQDFVLKRELKEGADITVEEISKDGKESVTQILKPTHKGKHNLSEFFLKRVGIANNTLVYGTKSLKHSALSLRILEKIFLVDEKRIISDESPMGTGNYMEKTQEMSLLKTLLTGIDDSDVLELKKRKTSKVSLSQKISNLESFLESYFSEVKDVEETEEELKSNIKKLETSISNAELELNGRINSNKGNLDRRSHLNSQIQNLRNMLDDDNTVLERFKLLLKKYASDRERIEANSEAITYVENHFIANCPTCGSEIEEVSDLDSDLILKSNSAEIEKIDQKVIDLHSTIDEILKHKGKIETKISKINSEINELNEMINAEVSREIREYNSIIKTLNVKRIEVENRLSNKEKRNRILLEIGELQIEHDEITDTYEIPDFSIELAKFSKELSNILTRWDFPGANSVLFDSDTRDFVIGGKPRGHFGKGYRAICFSAFIIALMSFLKNKKRHPGFVILDSPLTTYKKRDEEKPIHEEDEQANIVNNLIYAFYRDLCDFYNDDQIIVLDNQEPDKDLIKFMKYTHFSGNSSIGRPGFFPVKLNVR